jgi:hypothetical protein
MSRDPRCDFGRQPCGSSRQAWRSSVSA